MTKVAIALGSNLGDRREHLRRAVESLRSLGELVALSSLYETAAVGGPEQGPYLNAVAVVETRLPPLDLITRLQGVEAAAGRTRQTRWGPRTLDLDIVIYGGEQIDLPSLVVPHPRATERRFVLEPLAEVWPEAEVAPGWTAAAALPAVGGQRVEHLATEWLSPTSTDRGGRWVAAQAVQLTAIGIALVAGRGALTGSLWRPPGALLAAAGGAMLLWASGALGRNLTPFPEPRRGGELIDTGPYGMVRHPIYGGVILGMAGASLLFGSLVALVLVGALAGFFWAKSSNEERRLLVAFPGYPDYRRRVRRRFIPWVL